MTSARSRVSPTLVAPAPLPDTAPDDRASMLSLCRTRMGIVASVLWSRFLRFDAADPAWADRDRFVLSSSRFLPLLDTLLRLAGYQDETGQALYGRHPSLETAAGPAGQGFAAAVGMALAERVLAGRFGRTLVDHRTWVLACESDLEAGVALEAAALAGQIGLDKLVVLLDPQETGPETLNRFAAFGWAVRRVDAEDPDAVAAALAAAMRVRRPSLIACCPVAGASGAVSDTASKAEALATSWAGFAARGTASRRSWLRRLARHRLQPAFEDAMSSRLPARQPEWQGWQPHGGSALSSLEAARDRLGMLAARLPDLIMLHSRPGAAIVDGIAELASRSRSHPALHLACGVQEHGMAALSNGLSLHGGLRPVLGASMVSIDRMRPALRLAARMGQPVIYLLADDDLAETVPAGGGEDAGWQPVEQLASLRAMPHVALFRPADAAEVTACWELALARQAGPSLMALSARRPGRAAAAMDAGTRRSLCGRGGYVVSEPAAPRQATLIATGPELAVAVAAQALLAETGIAVAVVSLPCWELFAVQSSSYRCEILGEAPRIGIERASGFGWERWLGSDGVFIGVEDSGAQASADASTRPSGLAPEAVARRVRRRLGVQH